MIKNKINFLIGVVLLVLQVVSSLCFGEPLRFIVLFSALFNIIIGFI